MAENLTEVIAGGAVLVAAIGFVIYAGQSAGLTLRQWQLYADRKLPFG